MADKNAAEQEDKELEEARKAAENPEKKPGESGESDTENKDDTAKETDEEKGKEEDYDDTQPPEIPIRNSNAQHIIARKNEKIKKLEAEKGKGGKSEANESETSQEDEDDADDGLSDAAKSAVDKTVKKALAPLLDKLADDADEKDLQNLITAEPDAAKYAKHIRAYMQHDSYKGVPPTVIFHHLAWANAQAVGAKKKQAADLEAKQNKGGGRTLGRDMGGTGDLPSAEDIASMDEAEFERLQNDVLQGKYLKK